MIGLLAINQFTGCWSKGCFQSIHSGENLLWTLSTLAVTSCNLEWMRMFLDPFLWAGVASVEDEEDEEELLDEDDDEEATELLSSSFLDGAKGTAFAVALVCMRNGGTSSGPRSLVFLFSIGIIRRAGFFMRRRHRRCTIQRSFVALVRVFNS